MSARILLAIFALLLPVGAVAQTYGPSGGGSSTPATSTTLGVVKPDGTTITVNGSGVLTSVGSVSGAGGSNGQPIFNSGGAQAGATFGVNQVLGEVTAGTPVGLAVPSCATASSALTYTLGTGFGCNSITGGVASFNTRTNAVTLTLADVTAVGGLSATGSGASLTGLTYTQLPALSANTLLGARTTTTPSGLAVPSCSTASSALTWTSGTGFGCNSISGGGSSTTPVTAIGTSGTSQALAFATSGNDAFDITKTGNVALTFTGGAAGQLQIMTLFLRPGAGGFTETFPAGVKWPGGTPPTPSTSNINVYTISTPDAGVTLFGGY